MLKIDSNNISQISLGDNDRYVVRKSGVYVEGKKPNVFVRAWRFITGQYNRCKIAETAFSQFENMIPSNPQEKSILLANLRKIVNIVPVNKKKCMLVHDDLLSRLTALISQLGGSVSGTQSSSTNSSSSKSDFRVEINASGKFVRINLSSRRPKKQAFLLVTELAGKVNRETNEPIVNIANTKAVDTGGVSRDFLSTLIRDLVNEAPSSAYFTKEKKMGVPIIPTRLAGTSFNEGDKEFFEDLGAVLGFCANCEMPVGEYLSRDALKVIYQMHQDAFFSQDVSSYDFNDQATLNRFIPLYDRISETSYNKLKEKNDPYLKDPAQLGEQELKELYQNIQILAGEDAEEGMTLDEMREAVETAQDLMREDMANKVKQKMIPLMCMLEGMKRTKDLDDMLFSGEDLATEVLGAPLNVQTVLNSLQFRNGEFGTFPYEKRRWVENWVRSLENDDEALKRFVFACNGTTGWIPGTRIKIEQTDQFGPSIKFVSCDYTMFYDFNLATNEAAFHEGLSNAILDLEGFNSE